MIPALGIDPGAVQGGAVLLGADGCACLGAWNWKRYGRTKKRDGRHAYRLGWHVPGLDDSDGSADAPTLGSAAHLIAAHLSALGCPSYVLTVEGLFVAPGKSSPLVLAESAGVLYGPLEASAVNDLTAYRPRSQEWRSTMLGISERKLGKDGAERAAVALVTRWCVGLGRLATDPHVAEAAHLSRWGWLRWRHEQKLRGIGAL